MSDSNMILYIGVGSLVAIVVYLLYNKKENFQECNRGSCSPFMYPDMYIPQASCSDSFNWGFTYSTGRCPHAYDPQPRRLPSPK